MMALSRPLSLVRRLATAATTAGTKPAPATSGAAAAAVLPWAEFFRLRQQRSIGQRAVAIPAAFATLGGSVMYVASLVQQLDPTTTYFGMDPIFVMSAGALCTSVAGYFTSSVLFGAAWRVANSSKMPLMDKREKEYFDHIKTLRVPAEISQITQATSPLPDFYGEKVSSISTYRKWIRKQREYKAKALGVPLESIRIITPSLEPKQPK